MSETQHRSEMEENEAEGQAVVLGAPGRVTKNQGRFLEKVSVEWFPQRKAK